MLEIIDIKVEPVSRREFINRLIRWGKMGLLGCTGLHLLNKCTGTIPTIDDLDPPFICLPPCDDGTDTTNSVGPTTLVFSGYNPEQGFSGYNVWYGSNATFIESDHQNGDRSNYVLDQRASLDVGFLGTGPFPSYATSATVNATTFITLTIYGTAGSNFIYMTAYSASDNLDSVLSNQVDTSTI